MDDEAEADPDLALRAARLLGDAGNYRGAVGQLRGLLAIRPDHAPALSLMGLYLDYLGDRAAGIEACRAAVAAAPEDPEAHRFLGLLLGRSRLRADRKAALLHHREAVRLDPANGHNHYQLACLLFRMHRTKPGFQSLREACERAPDDPTVLGGAAHILFATRRAKEAKSLAARAHAAGPDNVLALTAQARVFLLAGRGEEAFDLARAAVAADATYAPAIEALMEAGFGRRRLLAPWLRLRGWIAGGRLRVALVIYALSMGFPWIIAASEGAGPAGPAIVLGLLALLLLYITVPNIFLSRSIAAARKPLRLRKTF